MKRREKKFLYMLGILAVIILAVNLTIPDKLVRLRIDSAEPEKIEYTIVSWSVRSYVTGFLDESVTLLKYADDQWVPMPAEERLHHDVGLNHPPFSRVKAEFVPDKTLEAGTYKLCIDGYIGGKKMEAGAAFEIKM